MAQQEVADGTFCPSCNVAYADDNIVKFGRIYVFKNKLNQVVKCKGCGYIHSWSTIPSDK